MAPRCHSLSDNHIRLNSSCSTLSQGAPVSVKYRIDVSKDGKNITATSDERVTDISSTDLISDFHLNVDDENPVPEFQPGQTRFNGTRSAILKKTEQDAPARFDI